MIEINLLPENLRKKERKKMDLPEIYFLPLAIYSLIGLVIIHLFFGAVILWKRGSVGRMTKKIEKLEPQKKEYLELKSAVDKATLKQNSINQLMVNRLMWSKKLNDLSDSMIPGVWLTKLYLERKNEQDAAGKGKKKSLKLSLDQLQQPKQAPEKKSKVVSYLCLEGYASSLFGEEASIIAKFITSLKNNNDFYKDFSDIRLDSIQRKTIKDVEVMSFKIFCYFKGEKTQVLVVESTKRRFTIGFIN